MKKFEHRHWILTLLTVVLALLLVACPQPTDPAPDNGNGNGNGGNGDPVDDPANGDPTNGEPELQRVVVPTLTFPTKVGFSSDDIDGSNGTAVVSFYASGTVSLTSTTEGTTFHYTLDGSNPTTNSAVATDGTFGFGPITGDTTIKVMGVKEGMANSHIAPFTITVADSFWYQVGDGERVFVRMSEPDVLSVTDFSDSFTAVYAPLQPIPVTRESIVMAYDDTALFGETHHHFIARWNWTQEEEEPGNWTDGFQFALPRDFSEFEVGQPITLTSDSQVLFDFNLNGSPHYGWFGSGEPDGMVKVQLKDLALGDASEPGSAVFEIQKEEAVVAEGGFFARRSLSTPHDLGTAVSPYRLYPVAWLDFDREYITAGMTGPRGTSYYQVATPPSEGPEASDRYNIILTAGTSPTPGEEEGPPKGLPRAITIRYEEDGEGNIGPIEAAMEVDPTRGGELNLQEQGVDFLPISIEGMLYFEIYTDSEDGASYLIQILPADYNPR